jgi:hypothetical protein
MEMNALKNIVSLPKSIWFLWGLLAASNAILAYSPLSLTAKLYVLFFGLLIPLIVFGWASRPSKGGIVTERESFSDLKNPWLWAGLIALMVFLRFFRLTNFHVWPTGDEGLHRFLAIDLVRNPRWQFFYTVGEHPPLLIWSLAWFFKFFNSPFFNLWFLPAVFSVFTVLAGFGVSRLFFSRSFSLIFTGLLAFSFWPLYFGRFCHQGLFIPFWELSCFWLLIYALKSPHPQNRGRWLLALGLWAGLGSLTFTAWLAVLFALTAAVFFLFFKKSPEAFLFYLAGLFAACLPFILSALSAGYGRHLIDASQSSHFFTPGHQAVTALSYLTSLFWGSYQVGTSYGPLWGGMLNPVLSASFLVGLVELFLRQREGFARWVLFFSFISLLPGLFTADYVELNRVIQVMPFLILITAIGLQKLFLSLKPGTGRIAGAVLLGLSSFFLDMNHLLKPLKDAGFANQGLSQAVLDDNEKAYTVLDSARSQLGPGLIYADFLLLSHNHSLSVTTYWFNAALNRNLDPSQARWAGVITNIHYQHYLARRFPKARWFWIDQNDPGEDGGLTVGVIPVDDGNRAVFQKWTRAHDVFHDLNIQAENILNQKKLYRQAELDLSKNEAFMGSDPFLESCYDEWEAQYHYDGGFGPNIAAIQRALQKGYPTAHLYCKLGNFYYVEGRLKDARDAYAMAMKQNPDYTIAAQTEKSVDELLSRKLAP